MMSRTPTEDSKMDEDRQPRQVALIEDLSSTGNGSRPCSAGLWKLLTEGEDGASAIRLVAINPTLRAELDRVAPSLIGALTPADPASLMLELVRHAPALGVHAKDDGEWAALFGVYLDALADLPLGAVSEAFARWHRSELYPKDPGRHAFFPKPAELYSLAAPWWTKIRTAAWRARRAVEYVERKLPREIPEEERKAVAEGLKTFAEQLAKRREIPRAVGPRMSRQAMAEQIMRGASVQAVELDMPPLDPGEII